MAKKVTGYLKLQVPAGAANPSPPINKRSPNRFQGLFPRETTFSDENIVQMGKDLINEPHTARAGIMKAPWWRRSPFIKGKIPAIRTPGKNLGHKGNQFRRPVNAVLAADWTVHYSRNVRRISYMLLFLK